MNFPNNFIFPEGGYPFLPLLSPITPWNFPSIPPPYPMLPPYPLQHPSLYQPSSNPSIYTNQQHNPFYCLNNIAAQTNRPINPYLQKLFSPERPINQYTTNANKSKPEKKQKGNNIIEVIQIISDEQFDEHETSKHKKKMIEKERKINFELKRLNCKQDPNIFIQKDDKSKQASKIGQTINAEPRRKTRVSGKIPKQYVSVKRSQLKEVQKDKPRLNKPQIMGNDLLQELKNQQKADEQDQNKNQIVYIQYQTSLPLLLSSQCSFSLMLELQLQLKNLKQSLIQRKMRNT